MSAPGFEFNSIQNLNQFHSKSKLKIQTNSIRQFFFPAAGFEFNLINNLNQFHSKSAHLLVQLQFNPALDVFRLESYIQLCPIADHEASGP